MMTGSKGSLESPQTVLNTAWSDTEDGIVLSSQHGICGPEVWFCRLRWLVLFLFFFVLHRGLLVADFIFVAAIWCRSVAAESCLFYGFEVALICWG